MSKTSGGTRGHTVAAPDADRLRVQKRFGVSVHRKIDDMDGAYVPADAVPIAGLLVYLKKLLHMQPF
jgi:hypothetical protein